MYLANPTLNGRYKKTFALKIDAVNYLEEITGYEMDKVTKFKGVDFIPEDADIVTYFDLLLENGDAYDGTYNPVEMKAGPMIRAEFAEYDWELVGKLTEV